jgi:polysaccharide export outer membrane protein
MVARQVSATSSLSSFSNSFESVRPVGSVLGPGDLVDVTIWEAPPAVLYGANSGELRTTTASTTTARSTTLPEQMIDGSGRLSIPFAGAVVAAGRTPREVEQIVAAQLIGKANQPQVIVRLVRNATANVTVVGEVTNSTRLPLSPKGERLLDAVAAAGGVRQPVGKTMIQVSRAGRVVAMPLEAVIKDPVQNIVLAADDVVTAYYQPFSFTALGAVNNNAEILNDDRANARGVFIFRLENPSALGQRLPEGAALTPDGKIPVIYRVDLKNPASFFVAQGFPIRNRDVLYVSNAPVTDLQKFMNIVSSMAFSVVGVANAI